MADERSFRRALDDLASTQTSLATLKQLMEEGGSKKGELSEVWNTMLDLRDHLIKSILSHDLMRVGDASEAFARQADR